MIYTAQELEEKFNKKDSLRIDFTPEQLKDRLVNHPPHYTNHPSGIECIQVTEHMNFCLGNAIKYLWRASLKDKDNPIVDLEKAIWYINREISRLKSIQDRSTKGDGDVTPDKFKVTTVLTEKVKEQEDYICRFCNKPCFSDSDSSLIVSRDGQTAHTKCLEDNNLLSGTKHNK